MERTDLGETIRKLRETYYKERQEDFGKRLGVSRVAVTRYETGERVPRRAILDKLLELATERQYVPGAYAFTQALGGRWELKPGVVGFSPVEPGLDVRLLGMAVQVFGNWSALQPWVNRTDESAEVFASGVDRGLRELMQRLHRIHG
jgi:transcriptional regulator with XRE-family HTH domain